MEGSMGNSGVVLRSCERIAAIVMRNGDDDVSGRLSKMGTRPPSGVLKRTVNWLAIGKCDEIYILERPNVYN